MRKHKPTKSAFRCNTTLEEMLSVKSFEELLKDGDIYDIQGASAKSGYTAKHLHRLCREDRIPHIKRGVDLEGKPTEVQYFFFAWQMKGLFSYKKARA